MQKISEADWNYWYDCVYAYFYRRVSNRIDVEDLTMETLETYFLYTQKIESKEAFVWGVAKRKMLEYIRKKDKNKMEVFELTWNFLREFFNYERYTNAIQKARNAIENKDNYQENWQKISTAIKERKFQPEEPLNLVNQAANQVLDENSDNEAYFWLDKLVYDLEILDDQIDEY